MSPNPYRARTLRPDSPVMRDFPEHVDTPPSIPQKRLLRRLEDAGGRLRLEATHATVASGLVRRGLATFDEEFLHLVPAAEQRQDCKVCQHLGTPCSAHRPRPKR